MKRSISVTPICPAKRRTTWKNAENVSARGMESQGAREERLQDDRGDEPDEGERLPDGHEEFGPEVVLGRPRAGEIRVQEAHASHDRKPTRHHQPGVETFVQQEGRDERETQFRDRRPQHGRTDLAGVESAHTPASAG